jgi:hypothetical protein
MGKGLVGFGVVVATSALLLGCGGGGDDKEVEPPPVMANCAPMQGQFEVDGGMPRTFALDSLPGIAAYDPSHPDLWNLSKDIPRNPAFLHLVGTGAAPLNRMQPPEGVKLSIERALIAPDIDSGGLGTLFAVAPGSGSFLLRQADQTIFDLRKVVTLQSCSDHPIAGEINLCFEADIFTPCPEGASNGMVESTPWTGMPVGWGGGNGRITADLTDGELRGQTYGDTITYAVIRTRAGGPFGGKVLCAGSGSKVVPLASGVDQPHEVWQLRNLGILEGSGDSRVTGCLR